MSTHLRQEPNRQPEIDESKMNAFLEKALNDMGGAIGAALVVIGDKLGLYKAMAGAPPLNSVDLAARTGTHERYIREWLVNQAAGGYITYDPAASLARARETLKPGGTVMIVEPMAAETLEGNLNPVGRIYAGASVLCCTPNAIASGQTALGTLATEKDLGKVALQAGFRQLRRVCETPLNRIFEARP